MHELSLMSDLFKKITALAAQAQAAQVSRVFIKLGALSHISPEHFRAHFDEMRPHSVAAHADLTIVTDEDMTAPDALDVVLLRIEVPEV